MSREEYGAVIHHEIPFKPGSAISVFRDDSTLKDVFYLVVDGRVYGALSTIVDPLNPRR